MFELNDLISIAKRENNTKRSYLYVNPIQGKHIPVSPSKSLELFSLMAHKIEERYVNESLLIIGFAETATAIGAAIAYQAKNCKCYLNTTREDIADAEYLFFTESHSHAMEQRLVINGMDKYLDEIDRIVFAEDEVTTGNTIEKLIRILQERYSKKNLQFGIISILNSMSDQRLEQLQREGIICDYIYHIPVQYRVEEISNHSYLPLNEEHQIVAKADITEKFFRGYWNSRIIANTSDFRKKVDKFVETVIVESYLKDESEDILILGTEEFMFPGMLVGQSIEKRKPNTQVSFHATTRSPIEISSDEKYPLHNRAMLDSIYGDNRRTFIYNLRKYDQVFIISDANNINRKGVYSICAAVEKYGNDNISLIIWGD